MLTNCSIHGQLAGRLCYLLATHDPAHDRRPWMAVLPTVRDFQTSFPLLWPHSLQDRLPDAARKILEKQRSKYERDRSVAGDGFLSALEKNAALRADLDLSGNDHDSRNDEQTDLETLYTHAWLLVNSRCFFWDYPGSATHDAAGRSKQAQKRLQGTKTKKKKPDRDDCMALCPVIDCFNHADREDVRRSTVVPKTGCVLMTAVWCSAVCSSARMGSL